MVKKKIAAALCVCMASSVFLTSGAFHAAAAGSFGQAEAAAQKKSGGSDALDGDLKDTKDEISDIKAVRKTAQERLESLKNDKSDLEAYIQELDQNLTEVQEILERVLSAMETTEAEIAKTQASLESARQAERDQYEAMKLRIQFMYETGEVQYLEVLLEAQSITDFLNRAEYISGMLEYDRDMLIQYQQTCQEIADAEAALERDYADLEELKKVNEESKQDLETLMYVKNTELDEYTLQIHEAENEIDSYTKALKAQEDLMKQIEAQIRKQEQEEERRRKEEELRRKEEESRRQEEENKKTSEAETEGTTAGPSEGSTAESTPDFTEGTTSSEAESSGETAPDSTEGTTSGAAESSGETTPGATEGTTPNVTQESTEGTTPAPTQESTEETTTPSTEGNGGSVSKPEEPEKPSAVTFQWPIPASSRITSPFGKREPPLPGMSDFHKGVDVGAKTGTKIYAAAAGTVVISQYNYSAGNYIMISHGNGVYTVYMHCSKLLVEVGDKVQQGDNIGLVGSTGYSTAPHLHFGVRVDGEYKNPLNYVSAP